MEIIISLVITAALLGIPTWLVVRAVKKAEKNAIVYSPEEVTRRLRRGFFLSKWGIELSFGSVLSFALMFCNIHIVIKFVIPISSVIVGLIMFFIGRFQIGMTTRYLEFCNRDRTELEEWVVNSMQETEGVAMQVDSIKSITKLTPGVTDDMFAALNRKDIITGFKAVESIYTGKNILKKHWPIISIVLSILVSVLFTIVKQI